MTDNYVDKRFIVTLTIPEGAAVTRLDVKRSLYRLIEQIDSEDAVLVVEDWGWEAERENNG